MFGSRQPTLRRHLPSLVRAYRDRADLGCTRWSNTGKHQKRRDVGESGTMGDVRLWLPGEPHLPHRRARRKRRRSGAGETLLLFQKRGCENNLGREQETNTATSERTRANNTPSTHRLCRADVENEEVLRYYSNRRKHRAALYTLYYR